MQIHAYVMYRPSLENFIIDRFHGTIHAKIQAHVTCKPVLDGYQN
jgi:hypothetical protein